jgi:secondary thiamine-phosphate synthase enzyme
MLETVSLTTKKRFEFLDLTVKVQSIITKKGIISGICVVYCPHTTAAITINEHADPSVVSDIIKKLDDVIPNESNYSHSEGNSAAHIKTSLVGPSVSVIIEDNRLLLGTWQGIFFCEFDGPRSRKVYVKIVQE